MQPSPMSHWDAVVVQAACVAICILCVYLPAVTWWWWCRNCCICLHFVQGADLEESARVPIVQHC